MPVLSSKARVSGQDFGAERGALCVPRIPPSPFKTGSAARSC